ncbi:MAG: choice-of-anchor D domain-containing protein, partial [Planctomycetes bacterium]|nr:choice-of-anchor D domain-containing protein [Planctomycetota bacterium]
MLFGSIGDWIGGKKRGVEAFQPAATPFFEALEPRVLLSAESIGVPPPVLLLSQPDEPPLIVQLPQSEDGPASSQQCILQETLVLGTVTVPEQTDAGALAPTRPSDLASPEACVVTELSCGSVTNCGELSEPAGPAPSAVVGDPAALPIEIRGPPTLVRAASDLSNWQGQVVYLDFDGATGVTYEGPVTVGPFEVPAFRVPGEPAGQEQAIIRQILTRLQETFAGSGVTFTTERPAQGWYSTLWIGGDDAPFRTYGSFLGLAEQVDTGNAIRNDDGFVFSDKLLGTSSGADDLVDQVSRVIGHETGHLLGCPHDARAEYLAGSSVLSHVALAEITVTGNGYSIADGDSTPSTTDWTSFGSVAQGGTPISQPYRVRNDGSSTLTISSLSVPSGFSITDGLSSSITPGSSDVFTVRLDTAVAGTKTGDIIIGNNDSNENPFNFRITGTVVASTPPEITVTGNGYSIADGDTTPSTTDWTSFGSVAQGATPISHAYRVRN